MGILPMFKKTQMGREPMPLHLKSLLPDIAMTSSGTLKLHKTK